MAFWSRWLKPLSPPPRAAVQSADGGVLITDSAQLAEYMRLGSATASGAVVTPDKALAEPTVYASVRLITGAVATMPLDIKRRVDARTREDASDSWLWELMRRRPNGWQKPSQFRRMLQSHVLLRGNAYCIIVRSRGQVLALLPLHPDRVRVRQLPSLEVVYDYRAPDGTQRTFGQADIFHLFGLTLDGYTGVTPITYARESIGTSLAMAQAGAQTFKHGLRVGGVLKHKEALSAEAREMLRASLNEYRSGGESEGKFLILEEGMEPAAMAMTAEDAQWIDARKFSRTDIAMFFGVPPFMLGDTEKSTSWGSGIEQQKDGFVTFTLEDHLTMWEEAISIDLAPDPQIYARFNRNALVKGNINDRWGSYVRALQWGVMNPNEVRSLEDENPREGGDVFYPPPNTAGAATADMASPSTASDMVAQ